MPAEGRPEVLTPTVVVGEYRSEDIRREVQQIVNKQRIPNLEMMMAIFPKSARRLSGCPQSKPVQWDSMSYSWVSCWLQSLNCRDPDSFVTDVVPVATEQGRQSKIRKIVT